MIDGEDSDEKYRVMHVGTVADRDDPEKLGRVRLLVPGVYDDPSPWAWPMASAGGGSKERGFFAVPEKGADVCVFFLHGDPEAIYYTGGNWGKGEPPSYSASFSVQDVPNVRVIETKTFFLAFDDRSGNEQLILKEKTNSTVIRLSPSGKLQLGSLTADQPYVLGTLWKTMMEAFFDAIAALTVPTGMGPSGPPINSATFASLKSGLSTKLSTIVKGV